MKWKAVNDLMRCVGVSIKEIMGFSGGLLLEICYEEGN